MSKGKPIRCFDYVNHPYAKVRDALRRDALAVFRNATRVATSRAHSVASELRVQLGGLEVGAEIAIAVQGVEDSPAGAGSPPSTRLLLAWEATRAPSLFPLMQAELLLYPLTATETQLDFSGRYEPPLGLLGSAVDAVVGHRIAEASIHRFVSDVAEHLRRTLS
jgi:hypothetical protein